MFRQSTLLFFAFLVASLPTKAQNTVLEKSIFWEVSGKGKAKIYILGTHHLYSNDFVKKSAPIQQALKKADIVIGEIVIDTNILRMGMKMLQYVYMKDNTLKKLLSPADYTLVNEYALKNLGMDIANMNTMKPIMLYQMLIAKKYTQATGKTDSKQMQSLDNSIDAYIQKEGFRNKKEVRGLEEAEDQMKILYDGYTLERQVEMLLELVKDEKSGSDEELQTMDNLYATQDLQALFDFTQKFSTPEETKLLLTNRNNAWIPQLEKLLTGKKNAFVAVGAGHLAGDIGILTQLAKIGYTLKPIKIALN